MRPCVTIVNRLESLSTRVCFLFPTKKEVTLQHSWESVIPAKTDLVSQHHLNSKQFKSIVDCQVDCKPTRNLVR